MSHSYLRRAQGRLSLCILLTCAPVLLCAQVQWQEGSLQELLQEAKEEEKFLFIDAYTDWCGWCKVMDEKSFSDPDLGQYMSEHFVSSKVNMEEGIGVDLAMKHRVTSYPSYLVLRSDGQLHCRLSGFLEADAFRQKLHAAVFDQDPLPEGKAPLDFVMDYPDWHRQSFLKRKDRVNPTGEVIQDWLASREMLYDEVSWGVLSRYVGGGPYGKIILEMRDSLIERYGKDEVNSKISSLIFNDVKTAIKDDNRELLDAALAACEEYLGEDGKTYQLRYRLYYYQMLKNWEAFAQVVETHRAANQVEDALLLQAAKTLERGQAEAELLSKAAGWIKAIVEQAPGDYGNMVLYTKLLYKSGQEQEALEQARMAQSIRGEDEQEDDFIQSILSKQNKP